MLERAANWLGKDLSPISPNLHFYKVKESAEKQSHNGIPRIVFHAMSIIFSQSEDFQTEPDQWPSGERRTRSSRCARRSS